jgi:anti-sigma B factor antagonist
MQEVGFQASSERLTGETRIVRVTGELDLYTAPELERALELDGHANERVVVDLSECRFIDSTALGILVGAHRRNGGSALLVVTSGVEALRAFEVSGLERHLTLHPSLESALGGAAP